MSPFTAKPEVERMAKPMTSAAVVTRSAMPTFEKV